MPASVEPSRAARPVRPRAAGRSSARDPASARHRRVAPCRDGLVGLKAADQMQAQAGEGPAPDFAAASRTRFSPTSVTPRSRRGSRPMRAESLGHDDGTHRGRARRSHLPDASIGPRPRPASPRVPSASRPDRSYRPPTMTPAWRPVQAVAAIGILVRRFAGTSTGPQGRYAQCRQLGEHPSGDVEGGVPSRLTAAACLGRMPSLPPPDRPALRSTRHRPRGRRPRRVVRRRARRRSTTAATVPQSAPDGPRVPRRLGRPPHRRGARGRSPQPAPRAPGPAPRSRWHRPAAPPRGSGNRDHLRTRAPDAEDQPVWLDPRPRPAWPG